MAVFKISSSFSFIFSILIVQLLLTAIPEYEAIATGAVKEKPEKKERVRNPKKSNKLTLEKFKNLYSSNLKTFHGQITQVPSLAMLMESSPFYLWEYYSVGIIMSDTCVVIRAYDIADTYNYPPTLYTDYYHTIFIPRHGCDTQHHVSTFTFNDPPYEYTTEANDIAVATTKKKIRFGNEACSEPVAPTWVSCDRNGPPPNYTDCYWASYGLTTGEEPYWVAANEEINPNANRIKILTKEECEQSRIQTGETIPFIPEDQICGQTPEGMNPYCPYDYNGALFCKYWGAPTSNNGHHGGGWARKTNTAGTYPPGWTGGTPPKNIPAAPAAAVPPPKSNTGGWNNPAKGSDYVAVGHQTYYYGYSCPEVSAAIFVKYGSLTYRNLFKTEGCGFKCSSELGPGEKCRGNPSPSLGPVYCIPESSNGWGEPSPPHGWTPSTVQLPNGWEDTASADPTPGWGPTPPQHGWAS